MFSINVTFRVFICHNLWSLIHFDLVLGGMHLVNDGDGDVVIFEFRIEVRRIVYYEGSLFIG